MESLRSRIEKLNEPQVPGCSKRLYDIHITQKASSGVTPLAGRVSTCKPTAAVYVSNLHSSVTEEELNYIFQKVGPIQTISVARHKTTKKSLGYGIIHFQNSSSVPEAISKCSGLIYKECQMKVEIYQSPEEREKSRPFTNLFVKNFLGAFDNDLELVDLFSPFGTITSWKLERDECGNLKGFGFICFQNPQNAAEATTTLHGRELRTGKTLYVAKHEPKERRIQPKHNTQHEPVRIVSYNNQNEIRPNSASTQANKGMISFPERVGLLKTKSAGVPSSTNSARSLNVSPGLGAGAAITSNQLSHRWKNNIYVKNIRGFVDTDSELFLAFRPFGQIVSAVVMKDESGVSKGFGFVCFENSENARMAIEAMHLTQLSNGKLLHCVEAQKKEERQRELRTKFRLDAVSTRRKVSISTVIDDLCNICYMETNPADSVMFDCRHINCKTCLINWFTVLIKERQVNSILCLGENCDMEINPSLIKTLVGNDLYETYDKILLENFLATQSDIVHCPTPGCEAYIELDFSEPTRGNCDLCGIIFCTNCNDTYHGTGPCDDLENDPGIESILRQYAEGSSAVQLHLEQKYGKKKLMKELESMTNSFLKTNCKQCPNCKANIEKNGGCNHMECYKCKAHFCWKCLMVSTRDGVYGHFRDRNLPGTSTACTMLD